MTDAQIHDVVATYLFPALIGFTVLCVYVFGIRPTLKKTPGFKELYEAEGSAYAAISSKFGGIKQKLATVLISGAGVIVLAHDQIAPLVVQAGVDPKQLLPQIPASAWPIITIAALWLMQYFRNLADNKARANAEALINAGYHLAAPAPGLSTATTLESLPEKTGV